MIPPCGARVGAQRSNGGASAGVVVVCQLGVPRVSDAQPSDARLHYRGRRTTGRRIASTAIAAGLLFAIAAPANAETTSVGGATASSVGAWVKPTGRSQFPVEYVGIPAGSYGGIHIVDAVTRSDLGLTFITSSAPLVGSASGCARSRSRTRRASCCRSRLTDRSRTPLSSHGRRSRTPCAASTSGPTTSASSLGQRCTTGWVKR